MISFLIFVAQMTRDTARLQDVVTENKIYLCTVKYCFAVHLY